MGLLVARVSRRGSARRDQACDLKGHAGAIAGYASLFDTVDQSNDRIAPGAFRRSLARRGAGRIKMLYQHQAHEPIGTWQAIAEDRRGLYVRGTLCLEASRGRDVAALVAAGALDGLSIGFRTVRARTDPRTGVRTLFEVDLWEISLVTFPMLAEARLRAASGKHRAEPSAGGRRMEWHQTMKEVG